MTNTLKPKSFQYQIILTLDFPLIVIFLIMHLLLDISPKTAEKYSSGTTTSTNIIGSKINVPDSNNN